MGELNKIFPVVIFSAVIFGSLLNFAPCSVLQPISFFHAPWRHDCQKSDSVRFSEGGIIAYWTWKSAAEIDTQENLAEYRRRAGQEDVSAQLALGHHYDLSQDLKEAYKWYLLAAEQGDKNGEDEIGWRYLYGNGIAKDTGKAFDWLRKAAEKGHRRSIISLGLNFEGREGYFWYYIFHCIYSPSLPREVKIPADELIKNCPDSSRREGLAREKYVSEEERGSIEREAEEWIRTHQIDPIPQSTSR